MPDDKDPPSEAEIADEIRQAASALSKIQTLLDDSVKPLQEQWASMAASVALSLQSLQDQMQSIAEADSHVAEGIQGALRLMQETITNYTSIVVETDSALAKQILEVRQRIQQILKRVDRIGELGWTVTMTMTFPGMQELSSMASSIEADAYMLVWYEDYDADLAHTEKRILEVRELKPFQLALSQCFAAYRRGEYAVTLTCLVAVLERGIRTHGSVDLYRQKHIEKRVKELWDKAKQEDPESIEVSVWMSFYTFVKRLYSTANAGADRLSRHGLQHGTQPPPNEKVEALRLFHALDTVTALLPG